MIRHLLIVFLFRNVLVDVSVDTAPKIKIIDFGIAKDVRDHSSRTITPAGNSILNQLHTVCPNPLNSRFNLIFSTQKLVLLMRNTRKQILVRLDKKYGAEKVSCQKLLTTKPTKTRVNGCSWKWD